MKKVNIVLHETTIINFPFFWKLVKRYAVISLLLPIFILTYSFYYYNSQTNAYLRRKYFKNRATDSDSPTSAIASVLGEKTSVLTESEIIGLPQSLDFQRRFAKIIYEHEDFKKLNFAPIHSKTVFNMDEFLALCAGSEKCILQSVRDRVFSMINVKVDENILNRFFVEVISQDSFTTMFLTVEVSKAIVESRINEIKHKIDEQIKISKEIAKHEKDVFEKIDLKGLKDQKIRIEKQLKNYATQIQEYNRFHDQLKIDLSFMETQVKETKKATNKAVGTQKILDYQMRERLENKIIKLEKDIAAIQTSSSDLTRLDQSILGQLEEKLSDSRKELKAMGDRGRKVSSEVLFLNRKEGESNFTEFEYNVKKKHFDKSKDNYDRLMALQDAELEKLSEIESKIEEMKPSFEYLRLLEQKIIQLTLLNSTVVSDLIFESEVSPQMVFKKTNASKIVVFSIAISFFILVIVIFALYFTDDRIYDQFELEKSFDDLTIIGNTPEFD